MKISARKIGFTLAEVLITLGIIGVVAALTLPSIMANTKKKEYSVRIKRFYSIMNQAIMQSEAVNGPMKYWTQCSSQKAECSDASARVNSGETFYNTYLAPYLNEYKTENKGFPLYVYLDDGSSFSVSQGDCIDILYDVNSFDRMPNEYGKDRFAFLICSNIATNWAIDGATFISYGTTSQRNNTREYNLNRCKSKPVTCSTLLQIDNWEFKNDYPYKL